jgi:predicted GIY-YIG superfamily endonuclease
MPNATKKSNRQSRAKRREWKFALIEADNPDWRDLWDDWFPEEAAQN